MFIKSQQPDDGLNAARGCINAVLITAGIALVCFVLAIIVLSL